MKKLLVSITIILFAGCNGYNKKEAPVKEKKLVTNPVKTEKTKKNKTSTGTYLCKINGEAWEYTKASGIVTTHSRTKKHTAIITFKKKLTKGSESIQLEYDAGSFQLISAALQLKFKNKEGIPFTCFYNLGQGNKKLYPGSSLAGEINLSLPSSASGTGKIVNIINKHEKEKMLDPENASLTVTDLAFSGVGYSDLDKVSNMFKKQ